MRQKLHSAPDKRRGISMAETAVALAIIMLVSAAAVSLLSSASRTEGNAVYTTELYKYAESAVDCFKWADNSVTYGYMVGQFGFEEEEVPANDLEGETPEGAEGENPDDTDTYDRLFVLEKPAFRIEVMVNFVQNEFEINAVDIDDEGIDGEEIYRFTYEK